MNQQPQVLSLSPPPDGPSPDSALQDGIVRQRFAVAYDYAVAFTRDCFHPANGTLAAVMAAGPGRQARCLAFVDMGVMEGRPGLPDAISAHFAGRDDLPALVRPPIPCQGVRR